MKTDLQFWLVWVPVQIVICGVIYTLWTWEASDE